MVCAITGYQIIYKEITRLEKERNPTYKTSGETEVMSSTDINAKQLERWMESHPESTET